MRTLTEMCALKVCDGMRVVACVAEHYPLCCEVVVSSYGPKPGKLSAHSPDVVFHTPLPVSDGIRHRLDALQV